MNRSDNEPDNRKRVLMSAAGAVVVLILLLGIKGCGNTPLQPWHSEKLHEEFKASDADEIQTFADYRELEDRLFGELEEEVYSQVDTGPENILVRFSAGSASDPLVHEPNWNRSFELAADTPKGGVLLLHGMSDSPYSLHSIGELLNERGYQVVGLRFPGHGTAPSGLKYIKVEDLTASVRIAMDHLSSSVGENPIHIIGYSMGAALALEYSLDATDGVVAPAPASLVLVSPAIRIHGAAAFASFNDWLSVIPGLGSMAWLDNMAEFDPYKYNSFATNAGDVVHRITRSVDQRIARRAGKNPETLLPPIIVFKSTVDATVTIDAVVDNLLKRLAPNRNELVLFDINRFAARSMIMVDDPGPLTARLIRDDTLPFAVTFITNEHAETRAIVARYKAPFASSAGADEPLGLAWPTGIVSLSHVALPFPPDDPLYGAVPPDGDDSVFLGNVAVRGERGLLTIPGDFLLRLRHNPFHDYMTTRIVEWLDEPGPAEVDD